MNVSQNERAGEPSNGAPSTSPYPPAAGKPIGTAPRASAKGAVEAPTAESPDELANYYRNAKWEYGYASVCHMSLPENLEGKVVLDVGCRRGKGVFKLSERVGAHGHAIGIDWVPAHIAEAKSKAARAARETNLPSNNMEFHLAYPEDLLAAGIAPATIDMAFVNSVLHLTYDPPRALAEIHRALKPGALLVCEVALATAPRDPKVVEAARTLGNSIQAAPPRNDFEQRLEALGFTVKIAEPPTPIAPNQGYKQGHEVSTAPSNEDVTFEAIVLHATKR